MKEPLLPPNCPLLKDRLATCISNFCEVCIHAESNKGDCPECQACKAMNNIKIVHRKGNKHGK